jgi:hypothetical protein
MTHGDTHEHENNKVFSYQIEQKRGHLNIPYHPIPYNEKKLGPVTIWGIKYLTEKSSNTGEDQKCPPVPFPDYL